MFYFIQLDSNNQVINKYTSNHKPTGDNCVIISQEEWQSIQPGQIRQEPGLHLAEEPSSLVFYITLDSNSTVTGRYISTQAEDNSIELSQEEFNQVSLGSVRQEDGTYTPPETAPVSYYYAELDSDSTVIRLLEVLEEKDDSDLVPISVEQFNPAYLGAEYISEVRYIWPPEKVNELRSQLTEQIVALRHQKESEGIFITTSDGQTLPLDTSAIGRANIQGTLMSYQLGLLSQDQTVRWKFVNGLQKEPIYQGITMEQLQEMAGFVVDYVEKLFQAEAQHQEAIQQLQTIQEIETYDLNQFWPDNCYQSEKL